MNLDQLLALPSAPKRGKMPAPLFAEYFTTPYVTRVVSEDDQYLITATTYKRCQTIEYAAHRWEKGFWREGWSDSFAKSATLSIVEKSIAREKEWEAKVGL